MLIHWPGSADAAWLCEFIFSYYSMLACELPKILSSASTIVSYRNIRAVGTTMRLLAAGWGVEKLAIVHLNVIRKIFKIPYYKADKEFMMNT